MFFLTRVCQYCKIIIGTKPTDVEPEPGLDKSHGICDNCLKKHHPDLAAKCLSKGGGVSEQ